MKKLAGPNLIQETFPVLGMSCAACAARVDKTLNRQEGVVHAAVNYAAATATVKYDRRRCTPEALRQAVQEAGYDLLTTHTGHEAEQADEAHQQKYRSLKHRTLWAVVLAVPVAVVGMALWSGAMPPPFRACSRHRWYSDWGEASSLVRGSSCDTARPTWTRWWP